MAMMQGNLNGVKLSYCFDFNFLVIRYTENFFIYFLAFCMSSMTVSIHPFLPLFEQLVWFIFLLTSTYTLYALDISPLSDEW